MVYLQGVWALERHDKKIARFVRNRCNLQNIDRGVMEDVTVQHLHDVSDKVWGRTDSSTRSNLAKRHMGR